MAVAVLASCGLASCGSNSETAATTPTATTLPVVQATAPVGSTTTAATVPGAINPSATTDSFVVAITIADVTLPPDDALPSLDTIPVDLGSVAPPPNACPGITSIPAGVTRGETIVGDVDGDGADDTVTAYTDPDGTPHVFVERGGANSSDVALALGGVSSVTISFEDVDRSLGAEVAPAQMILAIGSGSVGSAVATFLSPSRASGDSRCLAQWSTHGTPFTFAIDQRGPFSGLLCDGVAGRRYYVLRTASPDGLGAVATTASEIDHVGTVVTLKPLGNATIPDDASVQRNYGDIQNCDHPPLFPDFPAVPFVTATTIPKTSTTVTPTP